jgi:hypothetical protein
VDENYLECNNAIPLIRGSDIDIGESIDAVIFCQSLVRAAQDDVSDNASGSPDLEAFRHALSASLSQGERIVSQTVTKLDLTPKSEIVNLATVFTGLSFFFTEPDY